MHVRYNLNSPRPAHCDQLLLYTEPCPPNPIKALRVWRVVRWLRPKIGAPRKGQLLMAHRPRFERWLRPTLSRGARHRQNGVAARFHGALTCCYPVDREADELQDSCCYPQKELLHTCCYP